MGVSPTQWTWVRENSGRQRRTGKPGRLQSMGLQRVRHDSATEQQNFCLVFKRGWGFPGGSDGKASACNAGDPGSIPGMRISPGEGNGNPLQYSCLKKSHGRYCPWSSPGKNTGMGCYFLVQGIVPTQGSIWVSHIAGRLFTI